MTTALDIVTDAFKKGGILGEGQTLSAEDSNSGFNDLNEMLSQWQRKRWLVFHLTDTAFTATGAQSFTVGPAGNFALDPRPDRIESAYFVQIVPSPNLPVSYPLDVLPSMEDYADISLKTLNSWPECVFYDSGYPTASLFVWPVPTSGLYSIHILTKAILSQFATLQTDASFPLEYVAAMKWNLVLRLRASYPRAQTDAVQDDDLKRLARDSLNVIRQANTQIPRLSLPRGLVRHGGYNVFSDRSG